MAPGVKNLPDNVEDAREKGLIPESGRSSRGGNGKPLQYSCLKNPWTERGAWRASVHGVAKSQTQLNAYHPCLYYSQLYAKKLDNLGKKMLSIPRNTQPTRLNQEDVENLNRPNNE